MVNYCCVRGCGRNSKNNSNLYFHASPKDPERQKQWFTAAARLDVLEKPIERRSLYRFCSRHFASTSIKNKHLCDNAVPTLYLPGDSDEDEEEKTHTDIICNNCTGNIIGFRYKCLVCDDFDLCSSCESKDVHPEHLMLRIPTPDKFLKLKSAIDKWHSYHKRLDSGNCSSDDEPITKYKSYDSDIELSEDVKATIRKSINKSFEQKNQNKKKKVKKGQKRSAELEKVVKKQKSEVTEEFLPELVFADVNQIPSVQPVEVKNEEPFPVNVEGLPMMSIKLSDDLSSLFVEVHSQKVFP